MRTITISTIGFSKEDHGVVLPLSGDPIYVPVVSKNEE